MSDGPSHRGYLYALGAYVPWGFLPIYIKLLQPAGPMEILAHRVLWSVVFVAMALTAMRSWTLLHIHLRQPGAILGIVAAAGLIAINWGTYIYGVNTDRVVDASLGYFITPLVVILLGVTVLRERLRPAQWIALGVGGLAVAVLVAGHGQVPYLAFTLALSFGGYGLVKKRLRLPAAEGLFVETAVLALPAIGYLGWLSWQGDLIFGQVSLWHTTLLILAGAVTAIPLLFFAGAVNRISLTALGVLQYAAPVLQFGVGVLIFHEPMPPARLAGFVLVWLALIVFTVDGVRNARRQPGGTPLAATPEPAAATAAG